MSNHYWEDWKKTVSLEHQQEHNIVKVEPVNERNVRKLGKANYQIQDLEKVNTCAYFDYQRSKVYLRTNNTIRKAVKRKGKTQQKPVNDVDIRRFDGFNMS